jgi:hypothetical protein
MEHGAGKLSIYTFYRKEWPLAIEQYISRDDLEAGATGLPIYRAQGATKFSRPRWKPLGGQAGGSGRGPTNDKVVVRTLGVRTFVVRTLGSWSE